MGEYAAVKTSVWWDIENCCVPRNCDAQLIVQNMSSALATAGYRGPISVSAYGDTHQIPHNVQHALSSTGVSLNHVPAGIKDASDKKILVDMLFWAIDNPPPANYLLISGDRDFSNAIHKLKMRRYNILLAQPPNMSQTLTAATKSVWLWKSLVAGEPPLAQSPYISSTSSGNKVGLDKSKNIVSRSSDVTQDTNPEVQNILCNPQSDANDKADKKYGVKQPREMQTDNVSKPARRKQQKRSNPGGSGFTKHTVFKKSKGGSRKRLICFRCGDGHCAAECTFSGDCHCCGKPGHKDLLCRENPNRIVKWIPAQAHDFATSLPGAGNVTSSSQLLPTCSSPSGCSQQATPGASSPSPAPPMAPAPPHVVPRPTSSALCHRTSFLAYLPVLGRYFQVGASQLPPAWTQPPHTGVAASSTPALSGVCATPTALSLDKPDVVPQPTSSALRPPTPVLAYRPVMGQCHQVGSQLLPAWTQPPGNFWQAAPVVPAPHVTPIPPQPGVAASPRPAHYGVYPMPIPFGGHGEKYTPS